MPTHSKPSQLRMAFGTAIVLLAAIASAQNFAPPRGAKPELHSPLNREFYALADSKGAVSEAEKNLAADPHNPQLLLKLAQAEAGIWQYNEAVATCTRALRMDPQNAALYLERGHRELALLKFAEAESDLDRALSLDPQLPDAYYHLGLAHYFRGEFAQAADAFQHSVDSAQKTEDLINSSNWLYASLRRAGKTQQAARALARITPELNTSDAHSQFYLRLLRFFQGAMQEEDAVPPEPPRDGSDTEAELRFDTVAYGVGNWHLYNGNVAKAQEYFRRVTQGNVWVTWGFVGSELELSKQQ
jgi:tetratricopeptide (TPR) repeat protein